MNPRYEILDSKDLKCDTFCSHCQKKITGKHLVFCHDLYEELDGIDVKVGTISWHYCNDCANKYAHIEIDGRRRKEKKITVEDLIEGTKGRKVVTFNAE